MIQTNSNSDGRIRGLDDTLRERILNSKPRPLTPEQAKLGDLYKRLRARAKRLSK